VQRRISRGDDCEIEDTASSDTKKQLSSIASSLLKLYFFIAETLLKNSNKSRLIPNSAERNRLGRTQGCFLKTKKQRQASTDAKKQSQGLTVPESVIGSLLSPSEMSRWDLTEFRSGM